MTSNRRLLSIGAVFTIASLALAFLGGATFGWLSGKTITDSKNVWAEPGWQAAILIGVLIAGGFLPPAMLAGVSSSFVCGLRNGLSKRQRIVLTVGVIVTAAMFLWWFLYWYLAIVHGYYF